MCFSAGVVRFCSRLVALALFHAAVKEKGCCRGTRDTCMCRFLCRVMCEAYVFSFSLPWFGGQERRTLWRNAPHMDLFRVVRGTFLWDCF